MSSGVLLIPYVGGAIVGCGEPWSRLDDWLADFLTSGPRVTLAGNDLTLRSPTATLVFLDSVVTDPDRPLVGTQWTVNGYQTAKSFSGASPPPTPRLTFGADGRVDVDTTCNTGVGTFVKEATTLTLTGMTYTGNACADGEQSTADQHLRTVLADGELTVAITSAQMRLTRGELAVFARDH